MSHTYSTAYHEVIAALSPCEHPFFLLKIEHPLASPVRLINDTQDLVSNGENYIAAGLRINWPDDQEGQLPRAQLVIDNVTNLFARVFEQTAGIRGATVTMMEVLRSKPSYIERQIKLDVVGITLNTETVTLRLGYEDTLNKACIPATYRAPKNDLTLGFPGLF